METTKTLALISDTTHAQEPPYLNTVPGVLTSWQCYPACEVELFFSVSLAQNGSRVDGTALTLAKDAGSSELACA